MVGKAHETIGHGTGIGEKDAEEVKEKIEEFQGVMLDVMIMTARHGGTEIFSKVGWTEGRVPAVGEGLQEVTVMNLQCKWEAEIERRVPALLQRRRSLHPI